eukprot:5059661-Prymnesium_polylepis.1
MNVTISTLFLTPRAENTFCDKKCNGARLRLNIGHQAAARTPCGIAVMVAHPRHHLSLNWNCVETVERRARER